VQVSDVAPFERPTQGIVIGRKFHVVLFHHVARSADRCRAVIAVFDDRIAGSRHDETGAGRNVERVLAVAAGSDDVDRPEFVQVDRNPHFQQRFAESDQFLDRNTAH
jgi:hypothetical protein